MAKAESFPIDKIYVPVKRKKAIQPEHVQVIAESILEIGQQVPILVRADDDRFVLVEGLHRLEACKALGERTVIGSLVSADVAQQKTRLSERADLDAERDKMARLKKLRLEKETAACLAQASKAQAGTGSAELPRQSSQRAALTSRKPASPETDRNDLESPRTLSEWITQQQRTGGRY